jgi:hypothetical protein
MPRDGRVPTGLMTYWMMMEAREGNPTRLAKRLRSGVPISQAELDFLADLIEGKIKLRKPRPARSGEATTARQRREIVQMFLYIKATQPERQQKDIIPDLCEAYGVRPRFVSKLLSGLGLSGAARPRSPEAI